VASPRAIARSAESAQAVALNSDNSGVQRLRLLTVFRAFVMSTRRARVR
jgi:hypothetical protein